MLPPHTTSVGGGPGSRVRLLANLPGIEGGRSSDWGGLTLREWRDGEGGGGGIDLHQTVLRGRGGSGSRATHNDKPGVWRYKVLMSKVKKGQ